MTASTTKTQLWISELASQAGVSTDTVRFYEREGLLNSVSRTPAGYRIFDDATLDRLRFIQGAQRLGLRLADIRSLLQIRDTGVCPCEPAEQLLHRRLTEVDAQLAQLTALRADLVTMVEAIPGNACPDPIPGTWCPPGNAKEVNNCDC